MSWPWAWAKISGVLLNRAALMPMADQQQIAKTYISAFVEATLRDNAAYRPLFDSPQYGQAWLPDYAYITHSEDGSYRPLADFGEDIDLTTATLPGSRIETAGLSSWREQTLGLKWAANQTHAAYLVTDAEAVTLLRIRIEDNRNHGLPTTPAERMDHAIALMAAGVPQVDAARITGIPQPKLSIEAGSRRAAERLNGTVADFAKLPTPTRYQLSQITDDQVLGAAAELTVRHNAG